MLLVLIKSFTIAVILVFTIRSLLGGLLRLFGPFTLLLLGLSFPVLLGSLLLEKLLLLTILKYLITLTLDYLEVTIVWVQSNRRLRLADGGHWE